MEPPSGYLEVTKNREQDGGKGGGLRSATWDSRGRPKRHPRATIPTPCSVPPTLRPASGGSTRNPRVMEPCASGQHRRNMPSQTMGTGLCCPHAANTGGHRIPVDQGGAPAQATPPSAPFLGSFPPRTLLDQLPGLKPQGGKRKAASEPWEFLSSSKATYTGLHCLQQQCRHQIRHKIRHKHSSISKGKVFKNYSAQQKEKVQSIYINTQLSKPVSQTAF